MLVRNVISKLSGVFLILLIIWESISFRTTIINKTIFASLSLLAIISFVLMNKSLGKWLANTIFMAYLIFLAIIFIENYEGYILSDIIIVGVIPLYYFILVSIKDDITLKSVVLLCVLVVICNLMSFSTGFMMINNRFPAINLYLVFFLFYFINSKDKTSVFDFLFISSILFFTFLSGDRTVFLSVFVLAFISFYKYANKKMLLFFMFSLIALAALNYEFIYGKLILIASYRSLNIFDLSQDYSFMQRFNEIRDVIYYYSLLFDDGFSWIFGYGPGATIEPIYSYSKSNILSDGTVHHFHATPFVLLFRFGILGFIPWIFFLLLLGKYTFEISRYEKRIDIMIMFFILVVDQFMRQVLVSPMFFIFAFFVIEQCQVRKRVIYAS